jgi:hypothetical protein
MTDEITLVDRVCDDAHGADPFVKHLQEFSAKKYQNRKSI